MKVVILAGGLGTRLSEETVLKPKPMVEIGGYPILWHIMNSYSHFGFRDFVVALGYKGHVIKEYFMNYNLMQNNVSIDLVSGSIETNHQGDRDWKIDLIETGKDTLTGGRLNRLEPQLKDSGTFMLTYGDGVSDVDIAALVAFHKRHGKLATMTAVRPPARFGTMVFDGDQIVEFEEKPQTGEGWINGGFFVFEPGVFECLKDDQTILERAPLESLAKNGELMAFKHEGFWHCMDTLRDKNELERMWQTNDAPWKVG
ncbi:glucose-1-phosphate cytidylyltransferase [Candidatus Marinamargulisbacteria bacterium SCGC AG-439-L15]|nr:glucose-1-phosphate cytidylyltransferase [Candidatus Marinamargulisbacteria bacterium SCGC AG-439-L15]